MLWKAPQPHARSAHKYRHQATAWLDLAAVVCQHFGAQTDRQTRRIAADER